jgi:nucleoside-diphosphate-sugar epimerase/predicted dehydrogenase
MRLFVTGAGGFLGRYFVEEAVSRGHAVTACVRRPSPALAELGADIVQQDILEIGAEDFAPDTDAVVHFASPTAGKPADVLRGAVDGTLAVLRAAGARGVGRFLHVSSMSVYGVGGKAGAPTLVLEPHPEYRALYAESKIRAERALADEAPRHLRDGLELTIVRPGLVFGAEMGGVLAGTAVELPLGLAVGVGRPTQAVPLLHIDDLKRALVSLVERPLKEGTLEVYDVLSGDPPTKSEFLRCYEFLTGQARTTIWIPYPVAVAGAAAFDLLKAARRQRHKAAGGPGQTRYSLQRLYRFEPRALESGRLWDEARERPTGTAQSAIVAALSDWRRSGPAGEGSAVARRHSEAILAVADAADPRVARPADVVLLGAGRIAQEMHLPVLERERALTVRAVVDPDLALAREAAERVAPCIAAADVGDLDPELLRDATVVVASPGSTHHRLGMLALRRGAHLLLEKPAVLTRAEYRELLQTAHAARRAVTVIQNHRLRTACSALWRFLMTHDPGVLLRADVLLHSQRLSTERARWMRDEKRNRVLIMELGVHLLDIACTVGGQLVAVKHLSAVDDATGQATVAISSVGEFEYGAELRLDLDVSGTAQRYRVELTFERATCVLNFFPDGFRILARRGNPIDDAVFNARRTWSALDQRLRPHENGFPKRVVPHRQIYREHIRRLASGSFGGPFSLDSLEPTMESLFLLGDVAYGHSPAPREEEDPGALRLSR